MIEISALTKRYGGKTAVDDLTFAVKPGQVTGFLGPNGAGKSTTMRIVLGLELPDAGGALVGGRPYTSLERPLRAVGARWTWGRARGQDRPRARSVLGDPSKVAGSS
ncbi:ATP-binding cassette domain-containing protein [Nonomuraea sp. NPDC046570]|uniref:ATP-binding cassette domain-containing protein n=1 Tax=Nonomuraea sp. NPDC046570 TaxID=3155255 RepID=UPI0033DA7069